MLAINDKLLAEGRSTKGELILPLPGETKESFIKGLNNLLNNNTSRVTIYTLMLLYGTEFKNPEYKVVSNVTALDYKNTEEITEPKP